jgi:hypothetical protein
MERVIPDSTDLFDHATVLADDPIGDDGVALEVLHDREYRVRAFRVRDDLVLIRGAVRDQKPPGLYLDIDTEPLTIHHMQVDIEVQYPQLEIVSATVRFLTHPNHECPHIVDHYGQLVGLSIARGFTHRVRELFGGPRGCTHTTALLQAMAPVAIQCMWSMRMSAIRRAEAAGGATPQPVTAATGGTPEDVMWRTNLNSCHVWAEDSDWVAALQSGAEMPPPVFVEERMLSLGLKPDDWRRRMRGG